jgi:hypothetical protein
MGRTCSKKYELEMTFSTPCPYLLGTFNKEFYLTEFVQWENSRSPGSIVYNLAPQVVGEIGISAATGAPYLARY